jgi:predicted ATPase
MISEGFAACDATVLNLGRYTYLVLLANGQLRSGRIDDGLDTLDRAESLIRTTGARWLEAEVHRLRGDLRLARR